MSYSSGYLQVRWKLNAERMPHLKEIAQEHIVEPLHSAICVRCGNLLVSVFAFTPALLPDQPFIALQMH